MEIKPGKYKTREGNDAVVLATAINVDRQKIVGYIIYIGERHTYAFPRAWEDDGRCYVTMESEDDLVEFVGE
jgi:hypothetical protein